jgi:hypothetical protein
MGFLRRGAPETDGLFDGFNSNTAFRNNSTTTSRFLLTAFLLD